MLPHSQHDEPDQSSPDEKGFWRLMWLGGLVALLILAVQLYPYNFRNPGAGELFSREHRGAWAVLSQIALFIPMGVIETELVRRFLGRTIFMTVMLVALDAVLLSLLCETAQYWLPDRHSSLIDIVAATTGGVLGYLLAGFWPVKC